MFVPTQANFRRWDISVGDSKPLPPAATYFQAASTGKGNEWADGNLIMSRKTQEFLEVLENDDVFMLCFAAEMARKCSNEVIKSCLYICQFVQRIIASPSPPFSLFNVVMATRNTSNIILHLPASSLFCLRAVLLSTLIESH